MNTAQINAIRDALQAAFTDPTSDPVTSVFILGAVLIIVLMMVLGLLLLITPKRRKVVKVRRYRKRAVETTVTDEAAVAGDEATPEGEAEQEGVAPEAAAADEQAAEEPQAKKPRFRLRRPAVNTPPWLRKAFAWLMSVPVLLVLAFVSTYVITGTDGYCSQTCHSGQETVTHAARIDHASCVDCHEQVGIPGVIANSASRARMAVSTVMSRDPNGPAIVSSANCTRCHEDVTTGTTKSPRGIMMSHREPYDAGVACTSCHAQTGHSERRDYSMSSCLTCHDAKQASAECTTCHVGDPYAMRESGTDGSAESTQTMGSGEVLYPAVKISNVSCGGCHNEKRDCDSCHGIRMPHTAEFMKTGQHAKSAAFERKELCFEKCHLPTDCLSGCHLGTFDAHGANWKREHALSPRDSGCACHQARSGRTTPFCEVCH